MTTKISNLEKWFSDHCPPLSRSQRVLNAVRAWLTAGLLFLFSFCALPLNGFNPVSGASEIWIVRRPLTQEFDYEVE